MEALTTPLAAVAMCARCVVLPQLHSNTAARMSGARPAGRTLVWQRATGHVRASGGAMVCSEMDLGDHLVEPEALLSHDDAGIRIDR